MLRCDPSKVTDAMTACLSGLARNMMGGDADFSDRLELLKKGSKLFQEFKVRPTAARKRPEETIDRVIKERLDVATAASLYMSVVRLSDLLSMGREVALARLLLALTERRMFDVAVAVAKNLDGTVGLDGLLKQMNMQMAEVAESESNGRFLFPGVLKWCGLIHFTWSLQTNLSAVKTFPTCCVPLPVNLPSNAKIIPSFLRPRPLNGSVFSRLSTPGSTGETPSAPAKTKLHACGCHRPPGRSFGTGVSLWRAGR
jgi:hypothetical protein